MSVAHRLEALAAGVALRVLRRLGPVRASNVGGALARRIGPLLPVSAVAHRNLRLALPELDEAARRRIVRGVWENLGRTAAEFPHIGKLGETASGPGWELVGGEHVEALSRRGGPALLVTAHFGNWEVLPFASAHRGVPFASMYRPADNARIDAMVLDLRRASSVANPKLFPKGAQGARQMLSHLRQGGFVGLLQDQKMNDGIEARFFGAPAMTASAMAAIALKLRCPVVPGYALRVGPARFRVVCEAPVALPDSGDREADLRLLTQAINDRLEAWIRATPEAWLWLHRRWPKQRYADLR